MRKLSTLINVMVLTAVFFLAGITSSMAGPKGKSGIVDSFTTVHTSCHFTIFPCFGDGRTAGSEGTLFAQIGGIGNSEVFLSASWDWVPQFATRHPCALVDITSQVLLTDLIPGTNFLMPWTSTALVVITHTSGAVINAIITGGSVCEVAVPGPSGGGTNNEFNINFEVTGGTGQFAGAVGTGTIHFFFDSGDSTFRVNEVIVHID